MAPPVGARGAAAYAALAAVVAVTCAWDVKLLGLASLMAAAAMAASGLAVLALGWAALHARRGRRLAAAAGIATVVAVAVPTSAWAVETAGTPHTGSIPTAVSTRGSGAAGGLGAGGRPSGSVPSGTGSGGQRPGGGGVPTAKSGTAKSGTAKSGTAPTAGGGTRSAPGGQQAGSAGGSGGQAVSAALKAALEKTTTRWAAATVGSQSAATLELATGGQAVIAIGGFTGSDPAPTLAQFEAYVAAGEITYFFPGGQGGTSSQITTWVEAHFKATTIAARSSTC